MRWLYDDRDKMLKALTAGDRAAARKILDRTLKVLYENLSGERVSGESSFSELHDEVYDEVAAELDSLRATWDELSDDEIAAWLRRVEMSR